MAIQWIVFDLGGVVVELNRQPSIDALAKAAGCSQEHALQALLETQDLTRPELTPLEEFMKGNISVDEYYRRIVEKYQLNIDRATFDKILMEFIQGEDQATLALLAKLSQQNHQLACFSNTHAFHWDHMVKNYRCFDYFKPAFASHLTNLIKPDLAVFRFMERELNVMPAEAVFIDDCLPNVKAANDAGWYGIHFTDADRLVEELRRLNIQL